MEVRVSRTSTGFVEKSRTDCGGFWCPGLEWVRLRFWVMVAKKNTRVRDAKTGKFVPAKEAEKRPGTTVKETIPSPKKKK